MSKRFFHFHSYYSIFVTLIITFLVINVSAQKPTARKIIEKSLEVMGGETKIRSIRAVKIEGTSYQNHLQDSEHPEGPWVPDFADVFELRDIENQRLRRIERRPGMSDTGSNTIVVADGLSVTESIFNKQKFPLRILPATLEWYAQSPERILISALEANNLRQQPDEITQSVRHHVFSFNYKNLPVRLFINAYNFYPTALETVCDNPYDISVGIWGDVITRVIFSQWDLLSGGIHYPLMWNIELNGRPSRALYIRKVELNPQIADDSFLIPADAKKNFVPLKVDDIPLGRRDRPIQEIAPNVIQIPGGWYATLVRQSDGIVIIEAPISNGYSAKVIAEAQKRFPGVPIKAVITTSSYWWHFGGIREYAARNIPIYALDLNKEIIQQALSSPRKNNPDLLARSLRKPKLNIVAGKTIIGTGANKLELYPVRAATAQMMMVYLPQHKILYTSEMAQPLGTNGSFLFPHDLSNLMSAVSQEKLNVESVIGMHMSLTPWTKVVERVENVISEK